MGRDDRHAVLLQDGVDLRFRLAIAVSRASRSAVSSLRTPMAWSKAWGILRPSLLTVSFGTGSSAADRRVLDVAGDIRAEGDTDGSLAVGHLADEACGIDLRVLIARRAEVHQRVEVGHILFVAADILEHRLTGEPNGTTMWSIVFRRGSDQDLMSRSPSARVRKT